MSGMMLHGLGDCTPELNCGCMAKSPRDVGDRGGPVTAEFISHGPASGKVECPVCGRFGYDGGTWQEACRKGHPHADPCHDRMWATRSQRASHVKPRRRNRGSAT